jgi:phosphoribosylaminoimidazolecarboxamide formyltransferase / IMP cyclohydrolase
MTHTIKNALISVFDKTGLAPIVELLAEQGVKMHSTGGTQHFIEAMGLPCTAVEDVTGYPSILGGRVKTLHPKVFGGILARRDEAKDLEEVAQYDIPLFDLVIVDLYPFEETLTQTTEEVLIIEKIDIGGVSLIRAAAKNYQHVCVVAARKEYDTLHYLLSQQGAATTLAQRQHFAAAAFAVVAHYDVMIAGYFKQHDKEQPFQMSHNKRTPLRYGENPHQAATFYGDLDQYFNKLNGKELSYNNLTDVDAATQVIGDISEPCFAIVKHANVCGLALRKTVLEAWEAALAGDPESAFGGILATNMTIDTATAGRINELFFEVLIAPGYEPAALELLAAKKNRIILQQIKPLIPEKEYKRIFNGVLVQDADRENYKEWNEVGGRITTDEERGNLSFANQACKHLRSNAIAIVKDKQLIGKGCGQTSRIDALRQAIAKAHSNGFDTQGAVLASDAFFPFDDCVKLAHEAGIAAFVQPGGSIRDADSINYCKANGLAMVLTGARHFKH